MLAAEFTNGQYINETVKDMGLSSIRTRPVKLAGLEVIQRLIFVGSSCVGKSTIEGAVMEASISGTLAGKVSVPQRVVTRTPRLDDRNDIYFCDREEFDQLVADEELGLYGVKIMENGREELYGYLKPKPETLPVFFANNQTLRNRDTVQPRDVLNNALIAIIYAPDWIREKRMRERSPQLFEERFREMVFRLSETERAIGLVQDAHLIVKNFGLYEAKSVADVLTLIKSIVNFERR